MKQSNDGQHENGAANRRKRVPLGMMLITPGAQKALLAAGVTALPYLARHGTGDWGEVCAADAAENDLSLREGFRILSAYTVAPDLKIWIITEADRSSTTILLPEEY